MLKRRLRHAVVGTALFVLGMAAATEGMAEQITVVLGTEPDQLDPCQIAKAAVGIVIKQNVIETLTELDLKDGTVLPQLATSWERLDDLTWRFELRDGVTFHDGSPMNAEAVAKALERSLNPDLSCESALKFFAGVDVESIPVDENTIDFKTNTPVEIFPTMMSAVGISSMATPPGEITRDPIGTGAYKLAEWTPGQRVVLARSDSYWGETPAVSEAIYIWRQDSAVRAAMVKTGEATIAPSIAVQDATDPALDFPYSSARTSSFRIDGAIPPLDDVRLRRAVNMAIDREAMRGTLFPADAIPAAQQVPPSAKGYNFDLVPYAYDPDEARRLVEAARAEGVPVDREIVLIGRYNIYPNAEEVVQVAQAMLTDIGLSVTIKMTDAAEWFELALKPFAEGRAPNIFQTGHDNTLGDAVFTVPAKYHSAQSQATMSVPELDALIDAASVAGGDDRTAKFAEALRMIHEDIVADIILFHMVDFARINPRVSYDPTSGSSSELRLSRIAFN